MTPRRSELWFLVPALIAFIIVTIFVIPSDPYDYDPSDYMYAASRGFIANYTDENGIPFFEFLRMGLESGRDPAKRAALSEYIRASEDIALYRHFHAPLSIYYLVLTRNLVGESEVAVRWAMVFVHIICSVVLFFGCVPLAKRAGTVAGAVPFLLYLTSSIILESVFKVSPHALHIALTVSVLILLSRFHQTRMVKWWYGAVALLCLAMLTYEYAVFLMLSALIFLFMERKTLFTRVDRRERRAVYAWSAGLFLLLFFLLWPAGLLKLTVVKNYIFIAYFALVRRETIATESALSVWWDRLAHSPFESILLLVALFVFLHRFFFRKEYRYLVPFLVYISLMLLISIGNSLPSPTYVSSLYAAVFIPAGILLADGVMKRARRERVLLLSIGGVLLVANNIFHYAHRTPDPDQAQRNALVQHLRSIDLAGKKLLVPKEFYPSLHYYFQESEIDWYLAEKENHAYEQMVRETRYDVVCYRGEADAGLEKRMRAAGYTRMDRLYRAPGGNEELLLFTMREYERPS